MKKAFTLAEILIALVLIGVLTAILLPVAFHASPDESAMKFKKGNNILATVIRELVTSDSYYKNGDLGTRANGTLIDGTHSGDVTYFCNTFAEIVNTKNVNCSEISGSNEQHASIYITGISDTTLARYDNHCKTRAASVGAEIVTTDGIVFYQGSPKNTFGISNLNARTLNADTRYCIEGADPDNCINIAGKNKRWFAAPGETPLYKDENGFDAEYKLICMDIDGIGEGEDPFAYGIRADGKILLGIKASEWMKKSIQKEDN